MTGPSSLVQPVLRIKILRKFCLGCLVVDHGTQRVLGENLRIRLELRKIIQNAAVAASAVDGEVTITPGNDGSIKAEGKFKGSDNNTYKLILTKIPGELPTVSFQFNVNEDGITVLPSNDDPWDYYIMDADTYASLDNDADYVAEYLYAMYGDYYAAAGEYTFAWDGDEIANYCEEAGEYYLIVWGANADGAGPAAACKFDYEANEEGAAPAKVASKKNFKSMTAVPSYIKVRK